MLEKDLSRRQVLGAIAGFGIAGAAGLSGVVRSVAAPTPEGTPPLTSDEMAAIDAALGKKGKYIESEAVYSVPLPRNDLHIAIKGEAIPISFGFGGWVSFKKTLDGRGAILMSDTVLLEEEVNPLISSVQANGLDVSAIHNHFFYESPRIFYMHLHGAGKVASLAESYATAIKNTKLSPANQPKVTLPAPTAKNVFDIAPLGKIIGHAGAVNGPTCKFTVGRDDLTVKAMGAEITKSIGLNSWAAFTGSAKNAHVAGDIAMLEMEVDSVIKILRKNNIEVVALHNHMLGDDPRMVFLHYYGRGNAEDLAHGFRSALDQLGKRTMTH